MKHQGIILLVSGCIVGFVIAALMFSGRSDDNVDSAPAPVESGQEYGLVPKAESSATAGTIQEAFVDDRGLFVRVDEKERIVSAGTIAPEETNPAGYHYAVSANAVSPDGKSLYFCVRILPGDETCSSYIYHAPTDTIYYVKDVTAEEYVEIDVASLDASWLSDNRLAINGRASTSASEPWMLE